MRFGNFKIESKSPRFCYSTEEKKGETNCLHQHIQKKYFLNAFIGPIVLIAKNIESLGIACIRINPHIKFHYHMIFAEMYILINNVAINLIPPVVKILCKINYQNLY